MGGVGAGEEGGAAGEEGGADGGTIGDDDGAPPAGPFGSLGGAGSCGSRLLNQITPPTNKSEPPSARSGPRLDCLVCIRTSFR